MEYRNIMHYIRISILKRIIYPLAFLLITAILLLQLPLVDYIGASNVNETTPLSECVNSRHTYISTTGHDLYYTGQDYYINDELSGHYYYSLNGEYCRFYILAPSKGKPADVYISEKTIVGSIVKYDRVSDTFFDTFSNTLGWNKESLSAISDPYIINEVIYFTGAQKFLLVITLICFAFALLSSLYMLMLLAFPQLSRPYFRLKDYGNAKSILKEAEKELSGNLIIQQGNMALTPKYLFEFSADLSAIIPLPSVLWVFTLQNMKYSFKLRREYMTYSLRIVTIAGDTYVLRNKKKSDIDKILEVLTDRYPNFFYGYSEEHDKMVHYILKENRKEQKQKRIH